jgi:hypothetical protein
MLFILAPVFMGALMPMIVIEACVFRMGNFSWKESFKWSTIANILTTFFILPLVWGFFLSLQMMIRALQGAACPSIDTVFQKIAVVLLQFSWLCTSEHPYDGALGWLIPASCGILLVLFFLASLKFKAFCIQKMSPNSNPNAINRRVLIANAILYGELGLLPIIGLFYFFWNR